MSSTRNQVALMLFITSVAVVAILGIYTTYLMGSVSSYIHGDIGTRLYAECSAATNLVTLDELNQLREPEDINGEIWQKLRQGMKKFATEHKLVYVYLMREDENGMAQWIADNDTNPDSSYNLASPHQTPDPKVAMAFAGSYTTTDLESYHPGYEGLISGFLPITDANNTVVAVVGVDISDSQLVFFNKQINELTILLAASIIIVVLSGCANIFLQIRKERELSLQLGQQGVMATISQSFLNQDTLENQLSTALKLSAQYITIDRAMVVRLPPGKSTPTIIAYSPDRPTPEQLSSIDYHGLAQSVFPLELPATGSVPTLFVRSVADDYKGRFAVLKTIGAVSIAWSPIYLDSNFWGFISFCSLKRQQRWNWSHSQIISVLNGAVTSAITRTLADNERRDAMDKAIIASRTKGDFLSNMSHEMRTPMNAIIGMTTIAQSSGSIERKDYCLNKISEASKHLLGIINDVLDMSKIEANKLELAEVDFSLTQIIQRVVDIAGFKVREKNQKLTVELDEEIPPLLRGDDQRLAQVLSNLLSNACKFTPEGGSISVVVRYYNRKEARDRLVFSITDTGIGISEEQRHNLFQNFSQADSSITRRFGGTGLGLAISKRIVELMDGHIWVESEEGTGSTFSFTALFATAEADETTQATAQAAGAPDSGTNLRETGADIVATQPASTLPDIPSNSISENGGAGEDAGKREDNTFDSNAFGGNALTTVSEIHPDLSDYTILLAEDSDVNREVVLALLEDTKVTIESAEDGQLALDMFAANPERFDLILMDMQMPRMDGLEATRSIRALRTAKAKNIPIIAMTANVFREDVEKCLDAGMNTHLGKPIDLDALLRTLVWYLKN